MTAACCSWIGERARPLHHVAVKHDIEMLDWLLPECVHRHKMHTTTAFIVGTVSQLCILLSIVLDGSIINVLVIITSGDIVASSHATSVKRTQAARGMKMTQCEGDRLRNFFWIKSPELVINVEAIFFKDHVMQCATCRPNAITGRNAMKSHTDLQHAESCFECTKSTLNVFPQ